MRRCARCGSEKSIDDFPVDRAETGGRGYYCKTCRAEMTREWYARNAEQVRAAQRGYYATEAYRAYRRAYQRAYRARRRVERTRQNGVSPRAFQSV